MLRREWLQRDLTRDADTRPAGFEPFRDDRSEFGREVLRQMPSADVINLHWIAGFIDYQSFFNTSLSRPVVWTLHDMNPFTGGCHFGDPLQHSRSFVVPSIQDNFPNTILEAMSCATPVVGFDTGGIKEMICHRERGFLVPVENTAALAEALHEALREPDRLSKMGEICGRTIIDHFTLNLQATRYCKLYRTLLENVKTGRPHKNRGNEPGAPTVSRKGNFSV